MSLQFHMTPGAPDPVAPFSHAVEADGWLHVTGQMPFPGTAIDEPYPEGIEAKTRQVMHNLRTVLQGCGLDWPHVASVRVYLLHFEEDYERMNAVYASFFPAGRRPARTCVGVSGLAKGARIEIDLVARREAHEGATSTSTAAMNAAENADAGQQVDERLVDLEMKAAFTEDLADRLNEVIVRQQQQIDLLMQEVLRLNQQGAGSETGAARNLRDELPPHY